MFHSIYKTKKSESGGATTSIIIIIVILAIAGYGFYKMTEKQIEEKKEILETQPQTITQQ